jgi:hypothetical protein
MFMGRVKKYFGRFWESSEDVCHPFDINEVTALVRYASENGINPDGSTLANLSDAITSYNEMSDGDKKRKVPGSLISLYAKLAQATNNVNGRTLIDTRKANGLLFYHLLFTLFLLALAISNEMLAQWFADWPVPEEGRILYVFYIQRYVLEFLSPFIWGAIGACVYLLKKLYDIAAERKFDRRQLHGWFLRIALGAILAGVIYYLFDLSGMVAEGKAANGKAIAFLVGLGVKVVYGALEALIVLISEKLNLDAVRQYQVESKKSTPQLDKGTK